MENKHTYMFANVTAATPNDSTEFEVQGIHKDMMILDHNGLLMLIQDEKLIEGFLDEVKKNKDVVYERVKEKDVIEGAEEMLKNLPKSHVHALQTYVTPLEPKGEKNE